MRAQLNLMTAIRFALPLGWILATLGYFGAWIAHDTAALTLGGPDMAEFVKFLPEVMSGSLKTMRQMFYLPALAIVVSIALLVGSRWLDYPRPLRILAVLLAVPVSLQLLPPAWSLASLRTAEFRLQPIALAITWVLLAGFWLWGRLPIWLTAGSSAALSLAAAALCMWQMAVTKPPINDVYRISPSIGWGFFACMFGLFVITLVSVLIIILRGQDRSA
jgi:hypothetical protein